MNEPKIYYTDDYLAAAKECEKRDMPTFAAMMKQATDESSRAYEVLNHPVKCYGWTAYQIARYIICGKKVAK